MSFFLCFTLPPSLGTNWCYRRSLCAHMQEPHIQLLACIWNQTRMPRYWHSALTKLLSFQEQIEIHRFNQFHPEVKVLLLSKEHRGLLVSQCVVKHVELLSVYRYRGPMWLSRSLQHDGEAQECAQRHGISLWSPGWLCTALLGAVDNPVPRGQTHSYYSYTSELHHRALNNSTE